MRPTIQGHWYTFANMPSATANEPPRTIPILPIGKTVHGDYGEIEFTPQDIDEIIRNFKAGAFGQDIALSINHEKPMQGAPGWIRDLQRGADGKLYADVEWTGFGKELLADNRFRYTSAEIAEPYTRPDGQQFGITLTGLTLTNNPHFKAAVQMGLMEGIRVFAEGPTPSRSDDMTTNAKPNDTPQGQTPAGGQQQPTPNPTPPQATPPSPGPEPVKFEETPEYKAMEERTRGLEIQLAEVQLRETRTNLTRTFEEARIGPSGKGRLAPAFCEAAANFALKFSETVPEGAAADAKSERAEFIEFVKGLGTAWFQEGSVGMAGGQAGASDPETEYVAAVNKVQAERQISFQEAWAAVGTEQPELARRFKESRKS